MAVTIDAQDTNIQKSSSEITVDNADIKKDGAIIKKAQTDGSKISAEISLGPVSYPKDG